MKQLYDVLIIGGGVIGSAIAREMSRYRLTIGVLEKNSDVCCETSGRNSGVIHGGFAYETGSLKAKLCVEGNKMMGQLSEELHFPFLRCGKVLVGNTDEDMNSLKKTMEQGTDNGVERLEIVDWQRLHELVPAVVGEFGMYSPDSGIVDPFAYTIALAENAASNGVTYFFEKNVTAIKNGRDGNYVITASGEEFHSRWVINSAGLGCGRVSEMLGMGGYKIIGSKGDYIILDKRTGDLLPMPVYPVPSNTYMGIHVTNTTDGNVIVGPNAEITEDFTYYGVSGEAIKELAKSASAIWPCIDKKDYIRNYSGILPKWVDENGRIHDFKIEVCDQIAPRAINLIGIESPGLTAAVPIARYVVELMAERETLSINPYFNPVREGIIRFAALSKTEQNKKILENPDYGEVVCRCEKVTKAEIVQAIHNPLRVDTLTGIKYRTRSMMGRCQGGYCQMRIAQLMEEELDLSETEIQYGRNQSHLFFGKVCEEVGE